MVTIKSQIKNDINTNTQKYNNIVKKKLKYNFSDMGLLSNALIHSSFKNENEKIIDDDNEKLEFIGDSVLDLIVSKFLYDNKTLMTEGDMTVSRSNIVNQKSLAQFAKDINLDKYLMTSKSGQKTNIASNEAVLADCFEAVIGAIYLDSGFDTVSEVVLSRYKKHFIKIIDAKDVDYKSELCVYIGKKGITNEAYKLVKTKGPGHDRTFISEFTLNGKTYGKGVGKSKKASESQAAKEALKELEKIYGKI